MLVYDENHSPEMIKGRGKYQLPNIPHLYLPRASPKQQLGATRCRARFFGGSFGSFQRWTAIPNQQWTNHRVSTMACGIPTYTNLYQAHWKYFKIAELSLQWRGSSNSDGKDKVGHVLVFVGRKELGCELLRLAFSQFYYKMTEEGSNSGVKSVNIIGKNRFIVTESDNKTRKTPRFPPSPQTAAFSQHYKEHKKSPKLSLSWASSGQ